VRETGIIIFRAAITLKKRAHAHALASEGSPNYTSSHATPKWRSPESTKRAATSTMVS
jgi:hypothetical protein